MASRSPVAIKTKKARMLAMKEANYIMTTGIMAEYQQGYCHPTPQRIADINHAHKMKNRIAYLELCRMGIIVEEV